MDRACVTYVHQVCLIVFLSPGNSFLFREYLRSSLQVILFTNKIIYQPSWHLFYLCTKSPMIQVLISSHGKTCKLLQQVFQSLRLFFCTWYYPSLIKMAGSLKVRFRVNERLLKTGSSLGDSLNLGKWKLPAQESCNTSIDLDTSKKYIFKFSSRKYPDNYLNSPNCIPLWSKKSENMWKMAMTWPAWKRIPAGDSVSCLWSCATVVTSKRSRMYQLREWKKNIRKNVFRAMNFTRKVFVFIRAKIKRVEPMC